jgi:hypothetical protein
VIQTAYAVNSLLGIRDGLGLCCCAEMISADIPARRKLTAPWQEISSYGGLRAVKNLAAAQLLGF